MLYNTYYTLYTTYYMLYTIYYVLCTIQCNTIINGTVHSEQCVRCSMVCAHGVYTIRCVARGTWSIVYRICMTLLYHAYCNSMILHATWCIVCTAYCVSCAVDYTLHNSITNSMNE